LVAFQQVTAELQGGAQVDEAIISANVGATAQEAGGSYQDAIRLSFDDAQRGLKYSLLRITSLMRLSEQDAAELRRLAELAVQELDVTDAANAIVSRASAAPLVVAIANIVANAHGSRRAAACGAIFGVYTAFEIEDRDLAGILGAVAGAVAASTVAFVREEAESTFILRGQ
jgi:hypothetical protein